MNQQIAEKWVAELRSGKYKQTKHVLKKNGGFCCLGVLCEIAIKEGVIPKPVLKADDTATEKRWFYGPGDGDAGALPNEVRTWAGMTAANGRIKDFHGVTLASLNDEGTVVDGNEISSLNFDEIADVIQILGEHL